MSADGKKMRPMTRAELDACKPEIVRGDRVVVREENIRPWVGRVGAVKPSPYSGWWLEVDGDDGLTRSVRAGLVSREREV